MAGSDEREGSRLPPRPRQAGGPQGRRNHRQRSQACRRLWGDSAGDLQGEADGQDFSAPRSGHAPGNQGSGSRLGAASGPVALPAGRASRNGGCVGCSSVRRIDSACRGTGRGFLHAFDAFDFGCGGWRHDSGDSHNCAPVWAGQQGASRRQLCPAGGMSQSFSHRGHERSACREIITRLTLFDGHLQCL